VLLPVYSFKQICRILPIMPVFSFSFFYKKAGAGLRFCVLSISFDYLVPTHVFGSFV